MEWKDFLKFVLLVSLVPLQIYVGKWTAPEDLTNPDGWFPNELSFVKTVEIFRNSLVEYFPTVATVLGYIPKISPQKYVETEEEEETDGAIPGNKAVLKRILKSHRYVAINFYAPWCVHCQKFGPKFDDAARILRHIIDMDIEFLKVNGVQNRDMLEEYGVAAFPMVVLMDRDNLDSLDYSDGDRSMEDVISWISARIGPGGMGIPSGYLGKSMRPRWDRPKTVRFRIGDVVLHKHAQYHAVVIGWDAKPKTPAGWVYDPLAVEGARGNLENYKEEPHYLLLVDMTERMHMEEIYVPQSLLRLELGRHQVTNDLLPNYHTSFDVDSGRYLPEHRLAQSYPQDQ
eukprot:comp42035_c0_seq1/m.47450 comp42035_c0_seq1/g.47450  ORF comp42035_c0_seq1/g.47450 comp42035_c0_seq1/m.47450 type:complete len:343 (-) comp42035_c0_seq1:136-1164(-)